MAAMRKAGGANEAASEETVVAEVTAQPHGAVLVLDEKSRKVVAASENVLLFIPDVRAAGGVVSEHEGASAVIGRHLSDVFTTAQTLSDLEALVQRTTAHSASACQISGPRPGQSYCVSACRTGAGVVLSVEDDNEQDLQEVDVPPPLSAAGGPSTASAAPSLPFHQLARRAIDRMQSINTVSPHVHSFCDAAAQELRTLTGYDRVMIAHITDEACCKIIAESCVSELTSFRGKHFPLPPVPKVRPRSSSLRAHALLLVLPRTPEAPLPLPTLRYNLPLTLLLSIFPINYIHTSPHSLPPPPPLTICMHPPFTSPFLYPLLCSLPSPSLRLPTKPTYSSFPPTLPFLVSSPMSFPLHFPPTYVYHSPPPPPSLTPLHTYIKYPF
ncbi:unnamed protein product [Closterium sp. NIES-54]